MIAIILIVKMVMIITTVIIYDSDCIEDDKSDNNNNSSAFDDNVDDDYNDYDCNDGFNRYFREKSEKTTIIDDRNKCLNHKNVIIDGFFILNIGFQKKSNKFKKYLENTKKSCERIVDDDM